MGQAVTQKRADGHSTLTTPLRLHGQVIGALGLESTGRNRTWTEEEIQLLETVSDQVALALQSARFYEMEQQRRHVADTLRDTARVVGSTLDPQEVIERLLDQLAGLIDFNTASIQIIEDGQRRLLGGRGFELKEAQEHRSLQRPLSEDPLIQDVVQGRRAIVIPDTSQDPRWEQISDTQHVRSWIAAPMIVGQEVIGLLTVDHDRAYAYNLESAELVSAIAAQAAIAVQNARLFEQTAQRAEYERLVADITGRLRASKNLETVIETAARELGQTLGTSRVLVRIGLDEEGLRATQRATSDTESEDQPDEEK
jgi:GAF domain-containing protein